MFLIHGTYPVTVNTWDLPYDADWDLHQVLILEGYPVFLILGTYPVTLNTWDLPCILNT